MKKIIYWIPRIIAILDICFFGIFILEDLSHIIPTLILIIITVIAWNRNLIGSIVFIITGIFASFFYHNLAIGAPILISGLFFIANYFFVKKI